jgi:preprotein translocase subunit YajC
VGLRPKEFTLESLIFIAQGATTPAQSCAQTAPMLVMILVVFYFILWRPQQKAAKESQSFRDGLKDGDKVITAGGLHGKIVRLDGNVIELELAPKTKVRVERSQIVQIASESSDAESK